MAAFSFRTPVLFRDCDPAGILFFARPYEYAHDAFEAFVTELGFTSKEWFNNPDFGTPIRQSSCEYARPMRAGEMIDIHVQVANVGDSSFTLKFTFESGGEKRCEVTLVHVCIELKTFKKISIPSRVRERLEAHRA